MKANVIDSEANSDEGLMLDYCAGNQQSFALLYERHRQWLFRVLVRQCLNQQIAQEIFQETWLSLIRHAPSYQVQAKFTTWLYRLAHQRLIDYWRKNHKEKPDQENLTFNSLDDEKTFFEAADDAQYIPENWLLRKEIAKKLTEALNLLPTEQREIFLLVEDAGMTLPEASLSLELPLELLKSRLRYARQKLKNMLSEFSSEEQSQ